MGLAPYGDLCAEQTQRFINIIKTKLVSIGDDGSIIINQKYFTFMVGLRMVVDHVWANLFGIAKRETDALIKTEHTNLAAAIQYVTEEIFLKLAAHIKALTKCNNICISGGYRYMPNVSPYQGCCFRNEEVEKTLKDEELEFSFLQGNNLYDKIAVSLSHGNIIGWFQGRMEFGTRALGNRSILADPRDPSMKDRVNAKVKYREAFRPFAPVVAQDDASRFFEDSNSPFMMSITQVGMNTALIPAVTHVDNIARIQK